MAKINRNELVEKGVLDNLTEGAKESAKELKILSSNLEMVVELAKKVQKESISESPKNLKDLQNHNELRKQSNDLLELKIRLDNDIKKVNAELTNQIKLNNAEVNKEIKLRKANEDIAKKQVQTEKELIKNLQEEQKVEQQLNKSLQEVEKTKQSIIKTEEARVKQEKRIQKDRENEIKKILKEQSQELDAYQRKSKRLNLLRKEFKALSAEEGKSTKETKRLGREVQKLDKELKDIDSSAGQFGRKVGDYPKTMSNAVEGILKVAGAVATAKIAFDSVKTSLDNNAEGSENVRELTGALEGAWDQLTNVVSGAVLDLSDYGVAVAKSIREGDDLIDALSNQEKAFERTSKSTDDFGGKLNNSIDGQIALTKRVIEFEKAIRPIQLRIAELNGQIAEQSVIAGDSTRSFKELENAILSAQKLESEASQLQIDIAKDELSIIREKISLKAGGATVDLLNQETEALIKLKEAENDYSKVTLENEKEIRQIKQDRLERDLDILIDGFDNQKTINERIIANDKETLEKRRSTLEETKSLADESFKSQKDVLENLSNANIDVDELLKLDATELQKQIRLLEQSEIIEGRTLEVVRERRLALLDLTEGDQDLVDVESEAFEIQKDISQQEIILNELLTASGKKKAELLSKLEQVRAENEIENIRKRLELVKEGSIEELRLKQELNDALINLESVEKTDDRYDKLLQSNKDYLTKLETQLLKAGKTREEIEEELSANRIISLRQELDLLIEIYGEGATEVLEKELELQQALRDSNTEVANNDKELYEFKNSLVQGYTDNYNRLADERISKIDEEISKSQKQFDLYTKLASEGNITAQQSLTEQNNIIAQKEAEKAKIEQQKQQLELVSSLILGYNSALENGATPLEALAQASLGSESIKQLISVLPTFFVGTDNTGNQGRGIDGKGGFIAINHPNEMILNSQENNKLKGMGIHTRNELFDNLDSKMYNQRHGDMSSLIQVVTPQNDYGVVSEKLDEVTNAIKNAPQNNIELAEITQGYMVINQRKTKGNTTTTNRFKVN